MQNIFLPSQRRTQRHQNMSSPALASSLALSKYKTNTQPLASQNASFAPLPTHPQKIAQSTDLGWGVEAILGLGALLAGGYAYIANNVPALKMDFKLLGIADFEGLRSLKDIILKTNKESPKKLSKGNLKVQKALEKLLSFPESKQIIAQAGTKQNARIYYSSSVEDKLRDIENAKTKAKSNTGTGEGYECETRVKITRVGQAYTEIDATTTAIDKKSGQHSLVPIEQTINTYGILGAVDNSQSKRGIGKVPDWMWVIGSPLYTNVYVHGSCNSVPSKVITVETAKP
jgi:hypothetical protein